jgi:hypothetical protein
MLVMLARPQCNSRNLRTGIGYIHFLLLGSYALLLDRRGNRASVLFLRRTTAYKRDGKAKT